MKSQNFLPLWHLWHLSSFFAASRKNSNKESDLSEDDIKTIRASLYGLVKYYISKGLSLEEMNSILGYVAAIGDEEQVRGQNSKTKRNFCLFSS